MILPILAAVTGASGVFDAYTTVKALTKPGTVESNVIYAKLYGVKPTASRVYLVVVGIVVASVVGALALAHYHNSAAWAVGLFLGAQAVGHVVAGVHNLGVK
jgi:hypothetical protein